MFDGALLIALNSGIIRENTGKFGIIVARDGDARIEFSLTPSEYALFEDLRDGMSKPALAKLLVRYALTHADKAFEEHAAAILGKHRGRVEKGGDEGG